MSKPKKDKEYKLSEVHALKLEVLILKMGNVQAGAKELNERFGAMAMERNELIDEAREAVGAPEDFLITQDLSMFVPPPPAPPEAPPDPKE